LLFGASIQVTGDNQGAISCINKLRSPVLTINEALRQLFDISAWLGCDVIAQWVPRDAISEADALFREPDASDWGLHPELTGQICKRFSIRPSVDLFASDVHHQAPVYISRVFSPGCTSVDAFRLD
jgi:hypothetical protein